ncbi:MAG: COG3014 family protein [Bacteroidales bacterium]
MKKIQFQIISVLILALLSGGCATHYQRTIRFQEYVYKGELENAKEVLDKDNKKQKGKDRILYLMYNGWVSWMMGQNTESIKYLDEADRMIEDLVKQPGYEMAALVTNPGIRPYVPEDFEKVMVNYMKALNFLQMGKTSEALVEVRRINLKLNELNDKYKENKNRYSSDAFALLIMGLIYDASQEYNDAFIAYRNAFNVYESSYSENFGIRAPEQLKKDLLRTAYLNGFHEELAFYEKQFGMNYVHTPRSGGEVIFLWQNGLGPVKSEWSINFAKVDGEAGFILLKNDELDLAFPIYIGNKSKEEKSAFAELSFLRVAFPKYLERKPVFTNADVNTNGQQFTLQKAQDINAIAFKTLHDRMVREMAGSILRLATKKALEAAVRSENQDIGAVVGILGALTEKADTRNWQTLPYEIHYARIPVEPGRQKIEFIASSSKESDRQFFEFDIEAGKTYFHTFQSLESRRP